jgi:hypothetical protein
VELIDPIRLDELSDAAGSLPGDLSATIASRDVVIGELLDEELRLVGSGDPPGADPHWTPRLSLLDADQQETARDVVLRHGLAFGLIDDVTGHDAAVSPLLRIPGEEFEGAVGQLTWVHRAGDADASRGALLLRPDGTVLHDDIDVGDGLHLLVLRSAERAHAVITAVLDVRADASDVAAHADAGRPHPGGAAAVADTSVASCHLTRGPVWRSERPDRTVTTHATADGALWLIDDGGGDAPEPLRTDVPTLRRLASDLLEVPPDAARG